MTRQPSTGNVTNPGKGRESTGTARFSPTRKGQLRQPISQTGSSERDRAGKNSGNG
jgi:hypothetical protein